MSYLPLDEFLANKLPNINKQNEKDAIAAILKAASQFVDKTTGKSFAVAPADPYVRRFRGDGSKVLRIPAHVSGTATVETMPLASYYEHEVSGWLYKITNPPSSFDPALTDGFPCWTKNQLYNVAARWGWSAVPDDIIEAVSQITLRWWETQHGTLGQMTPTGFVIERDVPVAVRSILDNYSAREFEIL